MGEGVHHARAHQRGDAQRRTGVIGEAEKRGARRDNPAVHGHAVAGRRHAVLADAPVDVSPGEVVRRDFLGRGDLGVVRGGEVGRAGDEFRQGRRDHVERRFAGLAGGDLRRLLGELPLVGVDDAVEVLRQFAAHAPLELGPQGGIERLERLLPGRALRSRPWRRSPATPQGRRPGRRTARRASSAPSARPAISAAPGASPCALFVPARVGRPKPIVVLQAIMVGLSEFCAARTAARIAAGSCPSIWLAFQPADQNRAT